MTQMRLLTRVNGDGIQVAEITGIHDYVNDNIMKRYTVLQP